jgi:hypothetical protein
LLLGVVTVVLLVYRHARPPDRCEVAITGIPQGTEFLCLAAERDGQLHAMRWSREGVLSPFLTNATGSQWSHPDPNHPQLAPGAHVQWQPGDRYAVVTRNVRGAWFVTWLDPSAIQFHDHVPILGGGRARLELSRGVTEPLPRERLRELGLVTGWAAQ